MRPALPLLLLTMLLGACATSREPAPSAANAVHPHTAITEGVQECARVLLGRSLHKPSVFESSLLRCVEG